ncbi:alpha/beta fold hydrolase [Vibrio alfacsensis]|uniref:Alpha/beta fold hydrolase n=1 Tax=Vibrio alfacsensis TaxID=1074311 RepID=A0ABN5PK34_9VIBR|nr:alpha/beta fold hydrolase [Vibrio alfacsensis]
MHSMNSNNIRQISTGSIYTLFIKIKPQNAKTLVLIHGWPGSFMEFSKIIGPLTDPVRYGGQIEDSFNVVVPSLPGFGFSERPNKRGYTPERMANIIASLMNRLGYEHYGLQGGDWGSTVSRYIATNHSEQVTGLHLNFCDSTPPTNAQNTDPVIEDLTPLELKRLMASRAFASKGRAYFEQLSTKPQTVNYALNDSPAGLAAWIIENSKVGVTLMAILKAASLKMNY